MPACLAEFRLASPHNHMSLILHIFFYIYTHLHTVAFISGKSRLMWIPRNPVSSQLSRVNTKGGLTISGFLAMHHIDKEAWCATVHGVAKSWTQLSNWTELNWTGQEKVLVTQSCLTLCDHMDCNPPGYTVYGILQAKILEWVAIPSPEDLPNPGIEPRSPELQADTLPSEPPGKPSWPQSDLKSVCKVCALTL